MTNDAKPTSPVESANASTAKPTKESLVVESLGTPVSQVNGNAAKRHENPAAWDEWVRISESWGY